MLSLWWVCATAVGVLVIVGAADESLSRSRAQARADAVALALVGKSMESIRPLLAALDVRVETVTRTGEEVTVVIDSPWGSAAATATMGS